MSDPVRLVSEQEWLALERVVETAGRMTDTGYGRWEEEVPRAITRWRELQSAVGVLRRIRNPSRTLE